MGAILSLIPPRDLFYGALIALIIGFFSWGVVHERHIGAAQVQAEVQHTADVARAKDLSIQAAEEKAAAASGVIYEKAVAIPPVADLGVDCVRHNPVRRGPVPQAAGGITPGTAQGSDRGTGHAYDPSGAILTRARRADAQIKYLQQRLNTLEAAMTEREDK